MSNPIYALLSKQAGLRQQVDLIANNVANLSTTGFKREGLSFDSVVRKLDLPGRTLALAQAGTTYTDLSPGPLQRTGSALDLAIEGDALFAVETPGGVRYTRDGRFSTNDVGELVSVAGHRVLDDGGGPILIPVEVASISVSADGTLSADDNRPLAVVGLHRFEAGAVRREADGLFAPEAAPAPAEGARVLQGFIEGSNVNPIREITDLIEAHRAYEQGRAMLDAEDERLRRTIERVGQNA